MLAVASPVYAQEPAGAPLIKRIDSLVNDYMTSEAAEFESLCLAATPAGVEVVGFPMDSLKKYEGKRLTEIAAT